MTHEEAKKMPFQKLKYCRRCSSYKDIYAFKDDDWRTDWCLSCQNTPVGQIAKR